jgi:hypothetical protein
MNIPATAGMFVPRPPSTGRFVCQVARTKLAASRELGAAAASGRLGGRPRSGPT